MLPWRDASSTPRPITMRSTTSTIPSIPSGRRTVVARLFGGLGNQLFIYGTARALAIRSGARLVLDTRSGFANDVQYQRTFQLGGCNLPKRVLDDLDSTRSPSGPERRMQRLVNSALPFGLRRWIAEPKGLYEARLVALRTRGTVWLEGYWQDERYFGDYADLIRRELTPRPPDDLQSHHVRSAIESGDSIAIHLRLHAPPTSDVPIESLYAYYRQAIRRAIDLAPNAKLFAFSDHPASAETFLQQIKVPANLVSRAVSDEAQLADLWLMSRCRVLVLAPSTYSWWAGWLTDSDERIRIAPTVASSWNFNQLVRPGWITLWGSES
jgi:hypothetical protein